MGVSRPPAKRLLVSSILHRPKFRETRQPLFWKKKKKQKKKKTFTSHSDKQKTNAVDDTNASPLDVVNEQTLENQ